MADRRRKDVVWCVTDDFGTLHPEMCDGVMVAVLMDIRDELKQLNGTLNCHNTRSIPGSLRDIRAAVRRIPVPKKRRK